LQKPALSKGVTRNATTYDQKLWRSAMPNEKPEISGQFQTMLVLWASLLISQVLFLLLAFLIKPELFTFDLSEPFLGENAIVVGLIALLAVTAVVLSFVLRKKNVEKGIAEQKVEHVQSGVILGCVLCEASSLLGLLLAFAFDYQYFFLWIALGILGTLLHYPKRSDIVAANYRTK
jgi:hypothetical protein